MERGLIKATNSGENFEGWVVGFYGACVFLESIFIDQATLNGTRPNSPSGVKPARPLVPVGRYFKVHFKFKVV